MALTNPRLVKVQISAEFVAENGDHMEPITFGPVQMTAREWAQFDLQEEVERGIVANREERRRSVRRKKRAS